MGVSGLYAKQVGRVGWVYVFSDRKADNFAYARPISLALSNPVSEGREMSFDMTFTREEVLELGRALVMAASVQPQED